MTAFTTLAVLVAAQMSATDLQALRKYRYGKTSAQIEAMGQDAYDRFFMEKTPDGETAPLRGVAYGVYVDAYRENTGRRYRAALAPSAQTRLLELDRQMRFIGVLFARNDWAFHGGNAVDPDADTLDYAQAERQLYTVKLVPNPTRTARRLATYRKEIRERSRKEPLFSFSGQPSKGRAEIEVNLTKIDRALAKAKGLCRTEGERAVLLDFVASQAIERM